jgi:DNA-binding NarL/FixJ family response regulator
MRILLAEHHNQVRRALRTLLEEKTGHVLVGEVMDRAALFEQTTLKQPDLVLLDWELPGHTGRTHLSAKVIHQKSYWRLWSICSPQLTSYRKKEYIQTIPKIRRGLPLFPGRRNR